MTAPNPLADPAALLRRVITAYDSLQAASAQHANEPPVVDAAKEALRVVIDEARQAIRAHERWRREKRG